ncbi:hypothetical protein [Halobellus rubicundus]|uniref:DNA primase/polymerase bifunctional N-terminal domain-containing protein n=1 Tax=Halobellus rubicundus TaxID=2996466 RepID=A0ABD5ME27_9EURY
MSKSEPHSNNRTGAESDTKSRIEQRLYEAGVRVKRSVSAIDGTKKPQKEGHSDLSNQTFPGLVDENYTVHGGDGLVILDIDVPIDDLPEWIKDLPSTFVVESAHGGYHFYYIVEDDEEISNTDLWWGSVRYGWYALGPGSTIDHANCDEGKENCPGTGIGEYTIDTDKAMATLSGDSFEDLQEACTSDGDQEVPNHNLIAAPDSELVDRGELALHTLQEISTPAFNAIMDFLQGGTADFEGEDLFKENGQIDRNTHDAIALSLLYGTLRDYCDYDHDESISIATGTYTHYCREHQWTKDGQKRRWLYENESYRSYIITYALNSFDPERFKQLVEKKSTGNRRENNEYAVLTYDAIWTALNDLLPNNPPLLSNDMDPRNSQTESEISEGRIPDELPAIHEQYPGKQEVIDRAYEHDDGYNTRRSYEEAFRRLQAIYGDVKAARIGNTWVYYPADWPDPPNANYVLQYGQRYDPEEADGINSWTDEPELSDVE